MPSPVTAWVTGTFPTAKSLNLACYTVDGSGDHPNGIAFHAQRPILYETWTRAGVTFPSAPTGTRTVMSSSGATTSGLVVYDTAGYFGMSSDAPGNGYYQYTSAVKGGAGDGQTPGGWVLLSHLAAVEAGPTLTCVSADMTGTAMTPVSGTRQPAPHTLDNAAFFLDLVNVGTLTWQPALTVYDTASAAAAIATSTDASGQTCRLCAVWAAVSAATTGQAVFTTPGTTGWVAPPGVTSVTVAAFGGGGGGGGGDASGAGTQFGGGGAGGGEYAQGTVGVTPGNDYTVTTGAAGAGGAATLAGGAGGNSVFPGDTTNVTAHGGNSGGAATTTSDGTGGTGGTGSTAATHFAGGAGNAGTTASSGGGGGSSAGTAQAGANATDGNGAPAPAGGGPGGSGGKSQITVVQSQHHHDSGSTVTLTFTNPVQAGNSVIAFAVYQGVGATTDPTAALSDGTAMSNEVSADLDSLQCPMQVVLYDVFAVTGGQTGVTVTGHNGSGAAIGIQAYEVSGLGPNPQLNVSNSVAVGGSPNDVDTYSVSVTTTQAPQFWAGCAGGQQLSSFNVNAPKSSEGWTCLPQSSPSAKAGSLGTVYSRILSGYQAVTAAGNEKFSGTYSTKVSSGAIVAAWTTSATTAGTAPVVGPGGGGGGALGPANGGGNGANGQVTLTWTGASGSGYGTPALPAPFTGWTPATTVGVTSAAGVNLNGPAGVAGPLDFLSSPPVFRIGASAGQSVPNTTLTHPTFSGTSPSVDSYSGWQAATGQYQVQRDGLYLYHGLVAFSANTAGSRRAGVTVNGTTYWGPPSPAPTAGTANLAKTQVFSLKAGDTVSLCCRQDSGTALTLATTDQTRLLLVWLGEEGLPAGNWLPPDPSFRWASGTQGEGLGGDLSALLQQHLANDLGFLCSRPYFMGYQRVAQAGLATGAFSTVTLDTVGCPVHGSDVGDNYSGWVPGAANNYQAQVPGWYLEVGESFTAAASSATAVVTAGLSVPTSGGYPPSQAPDWYQALAATTTAGTGGGAAVFALHYLAAGESVTPQVMAAGSGFGASYSTQVGLNNGGWWYPHFEVVWLSE